MSLRQNLTTEYFCDFFEFLSLGHYCSFCPNSLLSYECDQVFLCTFHVIDCWLAYTLFATKHEMKRVTCIRLAIRIVNELPFQSGTVYTTIYLFRVNEPKNEFDINTLLGYLSCLLKTSSRLLSVWFLSLMKMEKFC